MSAWALGLAVGQAAGLSLFAAYALIWEDTTPVKRVISAFACVMNAVIVGGLVPLWWSTP